MGSNNMTGKLGKEQVHSHHHTVKQSYIVHRGDEKGRRVEVLWKGDMHVRVNAKILVHQQRDEFRAVQVHVGGFLALANRRRYLVLEVIQEC
jgi:hypothetical protein